MVPPSVSVQEKIPNAPNFQWIEFIRSDVATRKGIDNKPNKKQWKNIQYLAEKILQPLRDHFGRIRISSGFRSPELNREIGGSPTSFHSHGMAADIHPLRDGVSYFDILKYIHYSLPHTELIYEFPPDGWVHVGIQEGRENEKVLKLKDKDHNYEPVSIDYIQSIYG